MPLLYVNELHRASAWMPIPTCTPHPGRHLQGAELPASAAVSACGVQGLAIWLDAIRDFLTRAREQK